MMYKKIGEQDHRTPITEEVEEFREIGTAGVPDSKISESQMHFDDYLEDGELQKC